MIHQHFGAGAKSRYHAVTFIIIGLFAGIISISGLQRPSWIFFDLLQQTFPLTEQNHVAVIKVDQLSLNLLEKEGVVFPLPRQIYGAIAVVAEKIKARALVFDILFTESSSYGADDDKLFAELLKSSGLPAFFPAASFDDRVKEPIAVIKKSATALGSVHFENEKDGVFRQVPEFIREGSQENPTLAHVVYAKLGFGEKKSSQKTLLQNFSSSAINQVSLYDVLKYYREMQEGLKPTIDLSLLEGRIWLIGYTAPGLNDLKPMSLDHQAAGVMITATALANRLDNKGLAPIKNFWQIVYVILACILSTLLLIISKNPFEATLKLVLIAIVLPLGITFFCWQWNIWFNPLPIFMASLISGGTQLIWNFQILWKDRRILAKSLRFSMSPEMLDLIRKGEVQVSRFGEERVISVLFSDIAGFTALSERTKPKELVEILNLYLDEVVDLITAHSGYVDKFIGDAVMALWSAPVEQKNHAELALATAQRFQEICDNFNLRMRRENPDFPAFVIRVGVHSGTAVIGNIGAKNRHNYTAIGDSVNLASRLEAIGKNYDVGLVISEDTLRLAGALTQTNVLELDQIVVKGKSEPTRIYTMINSEKISSAQFYRDGLKLYYDGHWQPALDSFSKAQEIAATGVMMARCKQAIENEGVLSNWSNGAWTYDTK